MHDRFYTASDGDRKKSSRRIERRLFLAVSSISLCRRSFLHASDSLARWPDEFSSGPFRYHADHSLRADRKLLSHIANLNSELPSTLSLPAREKVVHVYLFRRQSTYEHYLTQYFDNVPQRRALFIKQNGPGMVFAYRSKQFETDVRHETTHAVLHNLLPMVPLWLDEGLAEYFEVSRADRYARNPHLKAVIRNARQNQLPSLKQLESVADLSKMGTQEYQDAFAWVHFCFHGYTPARIALQSYLKDIVALRPPGKFADRIRRSIPDVEYRFLAHYRRMQHV